MKNKLRQKSMRWILFIVLIFGNMTNVFADHYESFSVNPHLPDNQYNEYANYFDLMLQPKETQTLVVEVKNSGNETMIANMVLTDAITGDNATKLYQEDVIHDASLKNPLSSVATLKQNKIKVLANTSAYVSIDIQMPEDTFEGVILGGVRVTADTEEKSKKESQDGISLQNQIDYLVAIQLRNTEKRLEENLNLIEVGLKLAD